MDEQNAQYIHWRELTTDEASKLAKDLNIGEIFLSINFLIFFASILLFFNAHRIVRSTAVFYSGGAFFGVLSSLVVIAFILQKLLPRRVLSFPLYLGGWPLSMYVYYKAWRNFRLLVENYQVYLAAYTAIVVLISLGACYRFGPPSDLRTINLIKWTLQLIALIGIYFSCTEQSIAICLIFFLTTWPFWISAYSVMNSFSSSTFKWLRMKLFGPTPRRLLTEAEFEAEAEECTRKELLKMQEYCRQSPSAKNWKMISRLSDPRRMASFINGESHHVTGEESMIHSSTLWPDEDDDSYDEDNGIYLELNATQNGGLSFHKRCSEINPTYSSFETDDDD